LSCRSSEPGPWSGSSCSAPGPGGLPEDNLPRTPAGRIIREAADLEFEKYRLEAQAAPEDWRSWFRLSCAYDAAGDRKRARAAMRDAVRLFRAAPKS
jgi:hypothetical protein